MIASNASKRRTQEELLIINDLEFGDAIDEFKIQIDKYCSGEFRPKTKQDEMNFLGNPFLNLLFDKKKNQNCSV
jgi:hypothetical protein